MCSRPGKCLEPSFLLWTLSSVPGRCISTSGAPLRLHLWVLPKCLGPSASPGALLGPGSWWPHAWRFLSCGGQAIYMQLPAQHPTPGCTTEEVNHHDRRREPPLHPQRTDKALGVALGNLCSSTRWQAASFPLGIRAQWSSHLSPIPHTIPSPLGAVVQYFLAQCLQWLYRT